MNVSELVNRLNQFDPEMEVRIAIQPTWPLEHAVGDIVDAPSDDPEDFSYEGLEGTGPAVVYIGVGDHIGYLSGLASHELGWR